MEITGEHKVKASQKQVYEALLNPAVLKESIPGCTAAEYTDVAWEGGQHIKLSITPSIPGLSGSYDIFVKPQDLVEYSHLALVGNPTGPVGSIDLTCSVDLTDEGGTTNVKYNADAVLGGKLAALPEFVVKTGVKSALDHFFKNLEKHIN